MKRAGRPDPSALSVKSQRRLHRWRIEAALAAGETVVTIGDSYRLRDARLARLAFTRDAEGRLCVGYAVDEGDWAMVEDEPFSARALGYYQRWLKRHGTVER